MNKVAILALVFLAQTVAASASTTCAGADPAMQSVALRSVSSDGGLNRYELRGTVVNLGGMAQPSNTLQFVDIYKGSEKLDTRSVPPLRPGESYAFSYVSMRSRDAGKGTTRLVFQLDVREPSSQDCNGGNDRSTVSF